MKWAHNPLYHAALKGVGIARLPYGVVEKDIGSGSLVEVLPKWQFPEDIIHAVYPSRKGLLPSIQLLLNYLADNISPSVK
ncbi:LysR substrate-binding domain-containing protein [Providencia huaxiensis]|uniref:LysR substrate-binding domain-containing protein n=1 Tax=Providencia huaxiensis TaxID=2027290 RepID=A0ABU2IRY9_9GAMM|nr:LysR substrate-binding domain-containing protein [Providencia sp. PROV087]MDT0131831.1 LysR substrate-binding domain-containing protein [Providencia huaxiensis]MDT1978237.1 LysR substrate-binding domain-containing protein [Providencia huaxiensis]